MLKDQSNVVALLGSINRTMTTKKNRINDEALFSTEWKLNTTTVTSHRCPHRQ